MGKKKSKTKPVPTMKYIIPSAKIGGVINPVTKIIPDKRNKKPKHRGKEYEE